ncbi:MAG: DUF5663 domain-containing protein [Candidatus Saccharimonadales bacterium]
MLKIDYALLEEVGLGQLPFEEKDLLITQIREQLELRVGTRLADAMSDAQLDEFEQFIDSEDEQGALQWLSQNFPDYPKVVQGELEQLKGELKQQSAQIKQVIESDANKPSQ